MTDDPSLLEKQVFELIKKWVETTSRVRLLEAGVNLENLAEQFLEADGRGREFESIPLDSLPRKRRFKLYVRVKEEDGREITAIASTESTYEGTLRHPKRLDASEFTAKGDETELPTGEERVANPDGSIQERVRPEIGALVSAQALKYVQVIISMINTLINAGLIGRH